MAKIYLVDLIGSSGQDVFSVQLRTRRVARRGDRRPRHPRRHASTADVCRAPETNAIAQVRRRRDARKIIWPKSSCYFFFSKIHVYNLNPLLVNPRLTDGRVRLLCGRSDIHSEAVQAALAKHGERKMAVPMPSKRRSLVVHNSMEAYTPPGSNTFRKLLHSKEAKLGQVANPVLGPNATESLLSALKRLRYSQIRPRVPRGRRRRTTMRREKVRKRRTEEEMRTSWERHRAWRAA